MYVDDVVDACLAAATARRGDIYNVGTGIQTTLGEAVDVARRVLSIDEEPRWGKHARARGTHPPGSPTRT